MLKFKSGLTSHKIDIIVDNARTHSAKVYDINLFNKSPGTMCPYKHLEWEEDSILKRLDIFDSMGISKGLLNIAKELKLLPKETLSKDIKLEKLRDLVGKHPSFECNSKFERLVESHGFKIIWCPKFHCELNPIEGFWCDLKRFVRKNNDQDFGKFYALIVEAIDHYKDTNLNLKLWKRFWDAVFMYHNGQTYQDVLTTLFGAKSSANIVSHKKNFHFNNRIK